MQRILAIACAVALILATEGRGVGVWALAHAGPIYQNAGLPLDSLPAPIRRIRSMDGFHSIIRYDSLATALHDSLHARGDTLSFVYACALDALVEASNVMERHLDPTALPLAYRALTLKRATMGAGHPEVARSLLGLSHVEGWGNDRFERADSILVEAEAIQRVWYGPTHREVARVLRHRAEFRGAAGDVMGGRRLAEEALFILESEAYPDTSLIIATLSALSGAYHQMGRYDLDIALKRRIVTLQQAYRPRNRRGSMIARHNLGTSLLDAGRHAEARPHLAESVAYFDSLFGPAHLNTRIGRGNLGIVQFLLGDDQAARASLLAASTPLGTEDPNHTVFWQPLLWTGVLDLVSGDARRARPSLERAVAICRARYGEEHGDLATALEPLIYCLHVLGETDQALVTLHEARDVRSISSARGGWAEFDSKLTLAEGLLYLERRDTTRALGAFGRLIDRDAGDSLSAQSLSGQARLAVARILAARGALVAAVESALESERSTRAAARTNLRTLPERQALQLAALRKNGIDLALDLVSGVSAVPVDVRRRCLDEVIRSRSLVVDIAAERRRTLFRTVSARVSSPRSGWEREHGRLLSRARRVVGLDRATVDASLAVSLQEAIEIAEARSIDGILVTTATTSDSGEVGFDAVRATLRPRTALLSFWKRDLPSANIAHWSRPRQSRGAHYDVLVYCEGTDAPVIVPLGDAGLIEGASRRWLDDCAGDASAGNDSSSLQAGQELRRLVFDPLRPHLAGVDTVYIVGDGMIGMLNLSALPMADGSFLIERGPVVRQLSCERDLLRPAVLELRLNRPLLAVGGVDYASRPSIPGRTEDVQFAASDAHAPVTAITYRGASPSCGTTLLEAFTPLAGARAEVFDLDRVRRGGADSTSVSLLTGRKASEARVKRVAPTAGAIHLATHGFFLAASCGEGAARVREWSTAEGKILLDNPLTRCGLALAGANRRAEAGPDEDDGLLTGDEIAALDLSGVGFVVLSACNSGVGEVLDGEGVLGLQRAFKIAGAGPVVMSLWPVEDQATRQWMRHFYSARLTPGVTTAEATRRASLAILQERRRLGLSTRPSTWGAFVSVGVER